MRLIRANSDGILAGLVFGVLAVLMVPLPPLVLDLLLAVSITASLLIFLVALYAEKPVDFSAFPTVLLVVTIFRLALNVASTRLILLHGAEGPQAAGHVIQAFGNFVVGGNYVVGFILFCILITINFVVITKGAGRVAEVAARFTLDAMPGKQMAIDAELNSGLIDDKVARRRRAEVAREADFYGAMDGASKFIKGDAIAGILITLINILAGVIIGVMMNGLSLSEAATNYTLLTIGDGLAGQVPALIVSAAAGILVTRVQDVDVRSLDSQLGDQLFGNPRVMGALAVLVASFMLVPGLRVVFAVLAVVAGGLAWSLRNAPPPAPAEPEAKPKLPSEVPIEELVKVDPLVLEVGLDLVYLVDAGRDGGLVDRVQRLRRTLATELGVVLPTVNVRDNVRLGPGQYRVLLRGEVVGKGHLVARQNLAMDPGGAKGTLQGTPGVDPVYGLKGTWIPDGAKVRAQNSGFTVVDVPTVLTTHLDDLFRRFAHELFGRQQLADAFERLSQSQPKLVEEFGNDIPRPAVVRVFRNLIAEGIGVRDAQGILEALSEVSGRTKDPDMLTEFVRQRLARAVTARFTGEDGVLRYLALAADAEEAVLKGLQGQDGAMSLVLDPDTTRRLLTSLRLAVEGWNGQTEPVVLVPPLARGAFRRLVEKAQPRVGIVSPGEIVPGTPIERVGELGLGERARAPLKAGRG